MEARPVPSLLFLVYSVGKRSTGGSQHGRLTPVEEEDFKACVGNDNFKLVGVAESSLVRAERMMHMMQARRIAQEVPKRDVSERAVERFGGYFLRLAPLGGARS